MIQRYPMTMLYIAVMATIGTALQILEAVGLLK